MWVKPRARDIAWMGERIVTGRITVFIEKVLALDQARDAFALSEAGRTRGKVVLRIG
jgi:NADPH:quinone reductase-like Zn-dependent oxidoreductase